MPSIDQFPLEAEIALSEMRSEETLTRRLQAFHRLRVRRRGDVVGVLLDVDAWQQLVGHVARLEAEVEAREDEVAHMIVEQRAPGATFVALSDEQIAEIEAEFDRLMTGPQDQRDPRA
jgi:hypothetical protein